MDLPGAMTRLELDSLIYLDRVVSDSVQNVMVIEASAYNGLNLADIAKWIHQYSKPSS